MQCGNKINNNKLILWPLGDVFFSYLVIFPATLFGFCQNRSNTVDSAYSEIDGKVFSCTISKVLSIRWLGWDHFFSFVHAIRDVSKCICRIRCLAFLAPNRFLNVQLDWRQWQTCALHIYCIHCTFVRTFLFCICFLLTYLLLRQLSVCEVSI